MNASDLEAWAQDFEPSSSIPSGGGGARARRIKKQTSKIPPLDMNKFHFKAPGSLASTSSSNGSRSNPVPNLPPPPEILPSVPDPTPPVPMDDFWDDGIEDALLIQASQSAEVKIASQERDVNAFKHSERDLAELTRMLEDDEDWGVQVPDVPAQEKCLDKSKTIFHQQNPKPQNPMLSQYQDSFVIPQKKQSLSTQGSPMNGTSLEAKKKEAELIRLRKENEKLVTEKYAKLGEISFLKSKKEDLEKKLLEEREEWKKLDALQVEKKKQLEASKQQAIDSLQTEKDFLKQELAQLQESFKRFETNTSQSQSVPFRNPLATKTMASIPFKRKKTVIPGGLDASFADEENVGSSPAKRVKTSLTTSEVQTEALRSFRRCQLELRYGSDSIKESKVDLQVPFSNKGPQSTMDRIASLQDSRAIVDLLNQNSCWSMLSKCSLEGRQDENSVVQAMIALIQVCEANVLKGLDITIQIRAMRIILESLSSITNPKIEQFVFVLGNSLIEHRTKNCWEGPMAEYQSLIHILFLKSDSDRLSSIFNAFLRFSLFWLKDPRALLNQDTRKHHLRAIIIILSMVRESTRFPIQAQETFLNPKSLGHTFVPHLLDLLYASVIACSNIEDSLLLELCQVYVSWISAYLNLCYVGESPKITDIAACQSQIASQVSKSITTLAVLIVKKCLQYQETASPPAKLYSTARRVIIALHQVWLVDSGFIEALDGHANVQRQYIWMTNQFPKIKSSLNFGKNDEHILNDLSDLSVDSGVDTTMEH
ncbi:hypothetical protein TCAL_01275 [Tigriopus californicus]|uniref:Uncharacterized protein n=1 Tax=Tigriopus californicus TaxID=6832 RepID=A0A553PDA2_TIGCA|nr:uncharacterized protein LOC131893062 [Tigriopus californicus]TRY75663.1 hypothetical protein TCAL_01275 [Tigriopus californicus]|eukprot:TCALIF_01275-PA protein Name:"Protein of unknown function" AED:0.00 eAED:0.00 QI:56/1/1/1/0.81/0.75/12/865/766